MAATSPRSNEGSGSTTWTHKPDRMRTAARQGQRAQPPEASFRGLSRLPRTDPVTVTLTYRGGSVAWILVQGRGRRQAFPGCTDLYTLLSAIQGNWDEPD